jgi:hypothetical protein
VNILDENVTEGQQEELRASGIRTRHIGRDLGRAGMTDQQIIPLLHHLTRPSLFTCDSDFYHRRLRHANYCLVRIDAPKPLVAKLIQHFLRHPSFARWSQRKGCVIHVSRAGIRFWRLHAESEETVPWPE